MIRRWKVYCRLKKCFWEQVLNQSKQRKPFQILLWVARINSTHFLTEIHTVLKYSKTSKTWVVTSPKHFWDRLKTKIYSLKHKVVLFLKIKLNKRKLTIRLLRRFQDYSKKCKEKIDTRAFQRHKQQALELVVQLVHQVSTKVKLILERTKNKWAILNFIQIRPVLSFKLERLNKLKNEVKILNYYWNLNNSLKLLKCNFKKIQRNFL